MSSSSSKEGDAAAAAAASNTSKRQQKVKFEDLLSMVGDSGKWQVVIFLFTWIEGILIGCHHLSSSFLGASMDHWCNTSQIDQISNYGWTLEQRKNFSIPLDESGKFKSCAMYDIDDMGHVPHDFHQAMRRRQDMSLKEISCSSRLTVPEEQRWEYDETEEIRSIVNDWYLVCERLPLLSTVQGSYMGGVFVGCVVFGWASDRFGRRPTMLVAAAIQTVTAIITAFSVNYIMFLFFRFLVGFSIAGVFECGFVLVTEICGPKFRTYFGILTQFPFGIGAALLPIIAYFIRDWVTLQLAISIPCCLLATYYFFVPESPRWLMAEGRFAEALKILKDGAKMNGNTLPSDDEMLAMMERFKDQEEEVKKDEEAKTTGEKVYEVFKELIILVETPEMRKRTINIFYSWLVVAMVYYGLSFNSKNLGGNRYVNTFASGFVEVPAVVVIIPFMERLGRMKCYCGTFLASGVCCIIVAIISMALETGQAVWLPVTIAMMGKFLISMTFAIAYLYTAELFPTLVRNVAVGTASTFARIGSMSAPYIVDLLGKGDKAYIPTLIFGAFSASAGLLALMLPETLNRKMPETVAEVERAALRKKKKKGGGGGDDGEEMNALNEGSKATET